MTHNDIIYLNQTVVNNLYQMTADHDHTCINM